MAFELFGIIGVFVAVGYFLDKKFSTQPFLLILLLLVGTAAAFYRISKKNITESMEFFTEKLYKINSVSSVTPQSYSVIQKQ